MKLFRGNKRRRVVLAIASPFVFLIVIALGVIALPCETMRVVLANNAESAAFVRVSNRPPFRELWQGRVAAGETRELSLAAIPLGQFIEVSVNFLDGRNRELTAFQEAWFSSYPLSVDTYRYDLHPEGIRSKTIDGFWIDESYSKWSAAAVFLAQIFYVRFRCLDCEIATWMRQ